MHFEISKLIISRCFELYFYASCNADIYCPTIFDISVYAYYYHGHHSDAYRINDAAGIDFSNEYIHRSPNHSCLLNKLARLSGQLRRRLLPVWICMCFRLDMLGYWNKYYGNDVQRFSYRRRSSSTNGRYDLHVLLG
jgi:hypothetical protein